MEKRIEERRNSIFNFDFFFNWETGFVGVVFENVAGRDIAFAGSTKECEKALSPRYEKISPLLA